MGLGRLRCGGGHINGCVRGMQEKMWDVSPWFGKLGGFLFFVYILLVSRRGGMLVVISTILSVHPSAYILLQAFRGVDTPPSWLFFTSKLLSTHCAS